MTSSLPTLIYSKVEAWKKQRRLCVQKLRELGNKLDSYHKSSKKASVAGSTLSIGGVIAGAASLLFAPATCGLSLGIAAASNIAGAGTSIASDWWYNSKTKQTTKAIQEIVEEDRKRTHEIERVCKTITDTEYEVIQYLEDLPVENTNLTETLRVMSGLECTVTSNTSQQPGSKTITANMMSARRVGGAALHVRHVTKEIAKRAVVSKGIMGTVSRCLPQACKANRFSKLTKLGGLTVNLALLPIDVYELASSTSSLLRGEGHEYTNEINVIAEKLENEIKIIELEMKRVVLEITHLYKLISLIGMNKCSPSLKGVVNDISQILRPALDEFGTSLHQPRQPVNNPDYSYNVTPEKFTCYVVDWASDMSVLTYASIILWSAWKCCSKSTVCLRSRNVYQSPLLWTPFGYFRESVEPESHAGICTLFSHGFEGDLISFKEFVDCDQRSDDRFNAGRCLMLNLRIGCAEITIANVLEPNGQSYSIDFKKRVSDFVKENARGVIVSTHHIDTLNDEPMPVITERSLLNSPESQLMPFANLSEFCIDSLTPSRRSGLDYQSRSEPYEDNLSEFRLRSQSRRQRP